MLCCSVSRSRTEQFLGAEKRTCEEGKGRKGRKESSAHLNYNYKSSKAVLFIIIKG